MSSVSIDFDKMDKDAFVKDCKNVGDTSSESYKKIYWFSWKCFQVLAHIILFAPILTLFSPGC